MPRVPFPIVGGSYNGVSRDANPQRSINLYPEYDKSGGRQILRGTPGLTPLATMRDEALGSELIVDGDFPDNSAWTFGGGWGVVGLEMTKVTGSTATCGQVAGDMVSAPVAGATYRITFDVTALTGGLFVVKLGGTTHATPVLATGSYSLDITAVDATGFLMTPTLNLVLSIDNVSVKELTYETHAIRGMLPVGDYLYVVYGPYLRRFDSDFTSTTLNSDSLMSATGLVTMAHIRYGDGFQIMICDGTDKSAYIYDTDSALFTVLTDGVHEFQGGGSVTAIDGYFLSHGVGGDKFYNSEVADGLSWDAADDSRAWVKTSNILRMFAHDRLVWVFKEDGSEIFYNSGSPGDTQPTFQRMQGGVLNLGTAASWSVASVKDRLFFLAHDRTVQMAIGQSLRTVSTPQLSYLIEAMTTISDAIAYCYTEEGHDFYVLSFPTTDVTYVYDATTEEWHERQSYNTDSGVDGRHRSNCYSYFQNRHVVGDFANTRLYELDNTVYTDNGSRILRQRITQNVNEKELMGFYSRFEVHFEGGVGLTSGQGLTPLATLRTSKDGGHTWAAPRDSNLGKTGGYKTRTYWSRLGSGRDFAAWVSVSEPVKVVILGAYLDYEQGYA